MTPEEKANELINRYMKDYGEKLPNGEFALCIVSEGRATQCAIVAVEEIINELPDTICGYMPEGGTAMEIDNFRKHYFREVLTHLKTKPHE